MREGVQIDQIDRLKPGDVLVLDVPEEFKHLLDDYCLTNGKAYPLYQAMDGNLWIDCDCCGGGPGFGLHGLEAVGLLRFFRLETPEDEAAGGPLRVGDRVLSLKAIFGVPTAVWLTVAEAYENFYGARYSDGRSGATFCLLRKDAAEAETSGLLTVVRDRGDGTACVYSKTPSVFYGDVGAAAPTPNDTDWDGTDGLGDEPTAKTKFARIGVFDLALCPDGTLLFRRLGGGNPRWERVSLSDAYQNPYTPCGAQAMSNENPTLVERAECLETPFALERAKSLEAPTSVDRAKTLEPPFAVERDILSETPILLDRDMQFETTITGDRGIAREIPSLLDRAMQREQPRQQEPIDFLALNKEFSSK